MKKITLLLSMMLFALTAVFAEDVSESFTDFSGSSYGTYTQGGFSIQNGLVESAAKSYNGDGKSIRIKNSAGGLISYVGTDGMGKDGGLGTISFQYRHWDADGKDVKFQVSYSIDGAEPVNVGDEISVSSTSYTKFEEVVDVDGDNIIVSITSIAYSERLMIDEISITSYDPSAAPSPKIENVLPATETSFELGTGFQISGDVTTTDVGGIDSVLVVYGQTPDTMTDTLKSIANGDTYSLDMYFFDVDTAYGQCIAYGHNGEISKSSIITLYGVCATVEAPVADAAYEVTATSFKANWSDVSADKYLLNVWSETSGVESTVIDESFAEGTTEPTNWTFKGVGTYTSDASSGLAKPSLKFDGSSDTVTVDLGQDIATDLSFWIKGSSTDEISAFKIEGFTASEWVVIDVLTDIGAEATIVYDALSSPALPIALTKFRFSYTKSSGNVCFDDVVIKTGGLTKTPVLTNQEVSATTYDVTGLTLGEEYKYSVVALDAYGCSSEASNVIAVVSSTPTSVKDLKVATQVVATQGLINIATQGEQVVSVYDVAGRLVAKQVVNQVGQIAVKGGVYLVSVNNAVTKVAVK